jgi:hypothetical protein
MSDTHALVHGSPALWFALGLVVLVGGCLVVTGRRAWKVSIFSLALLLALFGLESAIHSVHHLSDPEAAASCALFASSQHVPGASSPSPEARVPLWTAEPSQAADAERIRPLWSFRSHEGRAPPALPSV